MHGFLRKQFILGWWCILVGLPQPSWSCSDSILVQQYKNAAYPLGINDIEYLLGSASQPENHLFTLLPKDLLTEIFCAYLCHFLLPYMPHLVTIDDMANITFHILPSMKININEGILNLIRLHHIFLQSRIWLNNGYIYIFDNDHNCYHTAGDTIVHYLCTIPQVCTSKWQYIVSILGRLAYHSPQSLLQYNKYGLTPFHSAAFYNNKPIATWLMEQCPLMCSATDFTGKTPFGIALEMEHADLMGVFVPAISPRGQYYHICTNGHFAEDEYWLLTYKAAQQRISQWKENHIITALEIFIAIKNNYDLSYPHWFATTWSEELAKEFIELDPRKLHQLILQYIFCNGLPSVGGAILKKTGLQHLEVPATTITNDIIRHFLTRLCTSNLSENPYAIISQYLKRTSADSWYPAINSLKRFFPITNAKNNNALLQALLNTESTPPEKLIHQIILIPTSAHFRECNSPLKFCYLMNDQEAAARFVQMFLERGFKPFNAHTPEKSFLALLTTNNNIPVLQVLDTHFESKNIRIRNALERAIQQISIENSDQKKTSQQTTDFSLWFTED